ncbi:MULTISPECIES: Hsp20/alpha crystallin family protein [Variovorax]|jgi:HSP20 family protein|uniref:Hsp20/alpha crystallin family protein n=1 Tax=Variovorax TaxID=34072 RepID=UPI00086D84C0|nr:MULTISPECIES: Hsp20/alpha crystallin family protein [Variovorax]MBN8758209.1 Hsp20/alpha crystallin family protein [Variovorax sp.]ODU12808.1 MAG: heat-shock protein Hsp20 [Variovorax sp. SCN 67-85]ODV19593.1 MAG: heat-shock protein Hsp20 [Variovorax sp. SCN 67-20]OJZ06827.1 MAG: heat-shock protein Hsp20 [Variovorax sp. 67-131]UKI07721.1 Hsp20/alpha crystallin family protein [Variovorax paradoxus]
MNTALSRLDRIENLFPDMLRRWARPLQLIDEAELPADIRLDINENDKEYLVTAEIPGARKEDVRVSIDGSYVSISAEIRKDEEKKQGRSIVRETYRGNMSRGFSLASEVDDKTAVAKLEDGVLHLTLPKREGSARTTLKIQ